MKYYEKSTLCLTYDEYVVCFTEAAYKSDKKRGKIVVYGRGGNGSEVLIDFESLPDERKAIVLKKYGNPYEYIVKQPLNDWVKLNRNDKAFNYYNSEYHLPSGLKLPEDYRDKYTKAITFLDAISHYTTDKMALKRDFNIKMEAFWKIVASVIAAEKVFLPKNRANIQAALSKYKSDGFDFIIEAWRFDNDNSKKVKDQEAEDVLMKLIELDNKHDDEVIAKAYNIWAKEKNQKTISAAAVGYRRRTYYYQVAFARDGKSLTYNTYNKQIKQHRPTSPLMLINSDDNVLDLYFIDEKNRYYRPVMYVVIDTYNDYILGYAVGETVTIELVKQAYRNAMQHVYELTGGYHLWHQIKSDKWSIDPELKGDLATFFKNQSVFFPAQVAQSKYIERVFGKPLHKVLKAFPNYSGANITAKGKNARPNPDALQKRAKNFPDVKHATKVIEMAINAMRHSEVQITGKSRQEMWLEAFHGSEFCNTRLINAERKLQLFGIKHTPREAARLQVNGLNFQLNNAKYSFDVPGNLFPEYLNRKVELYYDPCDMTKVLVTDNKGLRFVADEYKTMPSALADYKPGDRHLLDQRLAEKQQITDKLINWSVEREQRLERAEIDAQSFIQAGVLTKAINHKAQKVITGGSTEDTPENTIRIEQPAKRRFNLRNAM